MKFGTNFAQAIECRLKGDPIPKFDPVTDATVARFLDSAETYFPTEPQEGIFAERKIQFAMPSVNATMIGYIDVLDLTGPVARIRDHKTRSDKRYAPNFDKLTTDLQLNIYAYAIRHEGLTGSEGMSIGHINYIKPPKARATDLSYLTTEWQPEVFAREIPLDTERNELIMGGVKDEVAVMASLADTTLPASDIPLDTTGEACYSYGQPCPYSAVCPKVSLRFSPFTARTAMPLPPPPPSRTAASSAASAPAPTAPQAPRNAPPPPPSRAAAPAAQVQKNLPPPPPSRAAAPAPSVPEVSPPAAVSVLAASEAIAEAAVFSMGMAAAAASSGGINPPSDGIMPVVPVSSIPNITAATKAWLAEHRFTNSLQVANLTEQYLLAVKAKKGTTTELLKAADVLRGLHGVEAPNAFDYCPPLDGSESEPESTAASMLADLPDHAPATATASAPARARKAAKAAAPVATEEFAESDEDGETVYPPPRPSEERKTVIISPAGVRRAPMTLYLECSPLKGAEFVTLEEWLAPLIEQIERNNGVTSWRAITEFGRFNALLHAGVAQIINGTAPSEFRLPQHLVVLSIYSDYAKAIIDLLINRATLVVSK